MDDHLVIDRDLGVLFLPSCDQESLRAQVSVGVAAIEEIQERVERRRAAFQAVAPPGWE